jgi:hypothetical protein
MGARRLKTNKWYIESRRVIADALAEGRRQGLDGKELVRFVDEAYPFGERRNYPYQEWLAARRRLLAPYLPRRKGEGVDPDYWVLLVGRTDPGWEAAVARERLSEREIEADDLSDEEVAEYKEI